MFKALKVDYEKRTQNPEDFLNGLMGDGFDNISVAKEHKHSSRSQGGTVPPSRPSVVSRKASSSGHFANKILHGIFTVLILSIVGVIIWLFISGVFSLPEKFTDQFRRDSGDVSDTTSEVGALEDSENDADDTSSVSRFLFRRKESENEKEDENSVDKEESEEESSRFFDLSSLSEQLESKIDDIFSSEESSEDEYYDNGDYSYSDDYTNDDNGGYYDEDGNYYQEELPTAEDEWETESSQNIGEDINNYVNNLRDRYLN